MKNEPALLVPLSPTRSVHLCSAPCPEPARSRGLPLGLGGREGGLPTQRPCREGEETSRDQKPDLEPKSEPKTRDLGSRPAPARLTETSTKRGPRGSLPLHGKKGSPLALGVAGDLLVHPAATLGLAPVPGGVGLGIIRSFLWSGVPASPALTQGPFRSPEGSGAGQGLPGFGRRTGTQLTPALVPGEGRAGHGGAGRGWRRDDGGPNCGSDPGPQERLAHLPPPLAGPRTGSGPRGRLPPLSSHRSRRHAAGRCVAAAAEHSRGG